MKRETLFLKLVVILMGVPVLALCIFLVPGLANFAAELLPGRTYMKYFIFIDLYATAISFYLALYQAFKLLSYIDKNKAFSELSVNALKYIKYCAITISILYVVLIPFLIPIAEADDAPGLVGFPLIFIFASVVVAVFAAVLQKILKNAIDIKCENDLTV